MARTLAAVVLALAVGQVQQQQQSRTDERDKTCRPYGYVTCSFTGWCLNHCGEWIEPRMQPPEK